MNWQFPQGLEVLVKKASVDPQFAALLLSTRAEAAGEIGLRLDPAEAAMLAAVPAAQLEAIIAQTTVPQAHRRAFLGKAAAAMLVALGGAGTELGSAGVELYRQGVGSRGVRPDRPAERPDPAEKPDLNHKPDPDKKADPAVERLVIATVAKQLDIPERQVSRETLLGRDVQAARSHGDAIRLALQKQLQITIARKAFEKLYNVGKVIDYLQLTVAVKSAVVDDLIKRLKADRKKITWEASLADDLRATAAQRAQLRRDLARQLRVYIPWDEFKKCRTIGEVVDCVADAVRKRRAAEAAKEAARKRAAEPRSPAVSMGIRPPAVGGIRPGGSGRFGIRPER